MEGAPAMPALPALNRTALEVVRARRRYCEAIVNIHPGTAIDSWHRLIDAERSHARARKNARGAI